MSSGDHKKGKDSAKAESLDLGISAILAGHNGSPPQPAGIVISDHSGGNLESLPDASEGHGSALSEFQELADSGRWVDLVRLCESRLAEADLPEPRLWWVRAHLGALSMPVSFLVAPLDAVCRRARDGVLNHELLPLLRETGKVALGRLKDVGAQEQVDVLRDALFDAGVLESDTESNRRGALTVAQGISEGKQPTPWSASETVDERASSAWPVPPSGRFTRPVRTSRIVMFGAVAFCSLLLALCLQQGSQAGSAISAVWSSWMGPLWGSTAPATEGLIQSSAAAEQMVPALERRNPVGSLGALFYSIDGSSERQATAAVPDVQVTGGPVAVNVAPPMAPQAASPAEPSASPTSAPAKVGLKERINTTGPVEGPDFRERLRDQSFGTRPQELQPGPFDPVMSAPTRRPPSITQESRDSDRSEGGGVFRVLVQTSVLAEPSYAAPVVGSLSPGDRVFVEAHLGRWVRLRSKRGRGGFVLAEEVQPIKDRG